MVLFGLGKLFYVILLLINAVAVLSEERFLGRIGFGKNANEAPAFGQVESTAKSKVIKLIGAVQTLLRSHNTLSSPSDRYKYSRNHI